MSVCFRLRYTDALFAVIFFSLLIWLYITNLISNQYIHIVPQIWNNLVNICEHKSLPKTEPREKSSIYPNGNRPTKPALELLHWSLMRDKLCSQKEPSGFRLCRKTYTFSEVDQAVELQRICCTYNAICDQHSLGGKSTNFPVGWYISAYFFERSKFSV